VDYSILLPSPLLYISSLLYTYPLFFTWSFAALIMRERTSAWNFSGISTYTIKEI
jgi:hypothetical protein